MNAPSTPAAGSPGTQLAGRLLAGRYHLNRLIAAGGMAMVWEATDQTLARRVAVKILHPHLAGDEAFVRRFRGEAIAAARLTHPSIVSVYDTVSDQGVDAIVMELVSGTTMRADLDQHGPMRLAAVLAIGTQVADALGTAHASGLVHRDVKPANILLSADGRVLVADFGIAKAAEGADLTSDGSMVGTAKYLAPEQVEGGPVDGRTDLYALGVVLYEALTGRPPFQGDSDTATALARLHHDPVPPRRLRPDIPPAVEQVVLRAMARRPSDRYPDAASMRAALLAAGADPAAAPAAAQAAVAAARTDAATHPPLGLPPLPAPGVTGPAGSPTGGSIPIPVPVPPPPPAPASTPGGTGAVVTVADPGTGAPRRRRWPAVVAALTVAAIVAAGAAVLTRPDTAQALPIAAVRSFDPNGDNHTERDDLLANVTDDDPATAWSTERYKSADVEALKGGVGLVATTARSHHLASLQLVTPEGGWSARIHVVDGEPPADLAGWGEPVATVESVQAGTVSIDLGDPTGRAVLVWFTRVGPSRTATIGDLVLLGS